jgi:hypothetical protein
MCPEKVHLFQGGVVTPFESTSILILMNHQLKEASLAWSNVLIKKSQSESEEL